MPCGNARTPSKSFFSMSCPAGRDRPRTPRRGVPTFGAAARKKGRKWPETGEKRARIGQNRSKIVENGRFLVFWRDIAGWKGWSLSVPHVRDGTPRRGVRDAPRRSVGKIAREVLAGGHAFRQRAYPLKIVFFYVLSRRPGQATDASAMRSARGGQAPTFGADAPVPLGRRGGRAHRTRLQRAAVAARKTGENRSKTTRN